MDAALLILPGLGGSSHGHWQSVWETEQPRFRRVLQRDWDHPNPDDWLTTLDAAIESASARSVLIAHSLACARKHNVEPFEGPVKRAASRP